MAASDGKENWIIELESALLESSSDRSTIRDITRGRDLPEDLRSNVWQLCLGIKNENNLTGFSDIFDLPEQQILREDCQQLVDKLGNEEEDKVSIVSDLETVVTNFCKRENVTYERNNGWLEILGCLIALKLPQEQLYHAFCCIVSKFIPRDCVRNGAPFHLFRLLVLYHDPELCSFLDTKKISPDTYALPWFRSLFAATCNIQVVHKIWDLYFQDSDRFLIFFLALVILVNTKEQLLLMMEDSKQATIGIISSAPAALEAEDIEDFCALAKYYSSKTPISFRRTFFDMLYGTADEACGEDKLVRQALCLPVSVKELVAITRREVKLETERPHFFLVDCRPADQYNSGHLPTAFHLDASLMLQEPQAFGTAVQALFAAQRQAIAVGSLAGGEHLCFMGSGQDEEDQYVHMVIASFLQKHCQNVSIANGGYTALHRLLESSLSSLADHNPKLCIACCNRESHRATELDGNHSQSQKGYSFMGKISSVVRSKSSEMKDKLVDYITNPNQVQPIERHVSSKDKVGKRYRYMAPIFSIDDDHDGDDDDVDGDGDGTSNEEVQELVSISEWLKKPDVIASFKCSELTSNGYNFPSYLLVTESHMNVLREIAEQKDFAHITARRLLTSIVKITSKKRNPDLITFKYGIVTDEVVNVESVDRFVIQKASEATKIIKQQIMKLLEAQPALLMP